MRFAQNRGTERKTIPNAEIDYLSGFALAAAPIAAAVANYCDHVEHNEDANPSWITDAGARLGDLAFELASAADRDLLHLYAARLTAIESRNVLSDGHGFDGGEAALAASTWRDLQCVQSAHDRWYHPDVIGMSKLDQLRHYSFHLAKIVGAFAEARDEGELFERRLPDALLFAIKLRTVMGTALPGAPLPGRDRTQT